MDDPDTTLLLSFDHSFQPPGDCGDERCHDLFPEFLYIVVIPAAVIFFFIFIILFSLIVCCSARKCRKAREAAESEDQLATYEAVRRASASVRRMSHNNSTPLLSSRSGSLSNVRDQRHRRNVRPRDSCHSAPGTLQRRHRDRDPDWRNTPPPPPPPPAYGMPPAYPLADDVFLEPEIPLQDFPVEERRHQRHPRQRPYSSTNGYTTH